MSTLVDSDDGAERREVGFLPGESVIEEIQAAVQEQNRGSGAIDFREQLDPIDLVKTTRIDRCRAGASRCARKSGAREEDQ